MKRSIIVIGASAGGVEALIKLVRQLPADLPAAIFVVIHIPANSPSLLPQILSRAGRLPAFHPQDRTPIEHQHIYVAPPDAHMLLEQGIIRIVRGPKENRHRPAVDPLFRSAALVYGPQVIGVILTGALDDGTAGLLAVKRCGGIAIVQDPEDALYSGMPTSAMEYVSVDYCTPLADIGMHLRKLVQEEIVEEKPLIPDEQLYQEVEVAKLDRQSIHENQPEGVPSAFSCPECGGVLWEVQDGTLVRYRCRVGHAFSPESMQVAQTEKIEEALWSALKTLQEKASLTRYIQQKAQINNQQQLSTTLRERLNEIERNADLLSDVLQNKSIVEIIGQSHDEPHLDLHIDQQV